MDQNSFSIKTEKSFEGEILNVEGQFGQEISFASFRFKLAKLGNHQFNEDNDQEFIVKINSILNETFAYRNRLKFSQGEGFSTILSMSMNTTLPEKSMEFINELTANYIEQDLKNKNEVANNTVLFIDQQLASISDSLTIREQNLEKFKSGESFRSISVEGKILIEKYNQIEVEKAKYEVMQQLSLIHI